MDMHQFFYSVFLIFIYIFFIYSSVQLQSWLQQNVAWQVKIKNGKTDFNF